MNSRLVSVVAVLAIVAGMTSGCFAPPEAEPTPTPAFASEEEAFAAAEATYRAYVDALNQVDLSDPETFEDVYAWTTGELNADDRESLSRMHADGWSVGGTSAIKRLDRRSVSMAFNVEIGACVDVSTVTLEDQAGESQVSDNRPAIQATVVTLVPGDSPTGLRVADAQGAEPDPPC